MQGKPVFAVAVEPLLLLLFLEISADKEESYVNAVDIESPGNDHVVVVARDLMRLMGLRSIESESCGIGSLIIIIMFNSNVISSQPRDLIAAPI